LSRRAWQAYKDSFHDYWGDVNQLERDLFAIYMHVKNGGEGITDLLDVAHSQEEELKEIASDEYCITWLTQQEYNAEASKIFSEQGGRHYNEDLAKKIMEMKINRIEDLMEPEVTMTKDQFLIQCLYDSERPWIKENYSKESYYKEFLMDMRYDRPEEWEILKSNIFKKAKTA